MKIHSSHIRRFLVLLLLLGSVFQLKAQYSEVKLNGLVFAYPPVLINDFKKNGDGWSREPVLRRMPDGSLLCLHYTGGPWEPDNGNFVVATRSTDEGKTWSSPEPFLKHPTRAVWSPELFVSDKTVFVPINTFDAPTWYNNLKTFTTVSTDAGKTWTEPVSLPGFASSFTLRRGFVMSNGEWFFSAFCQEQADGFTQKFSRQKLIEGKNWPFCVSALVCKPGWKDIEMHGYHKREDLGMLWEPNTVEVAPGHLVMLMRASGTGVLYRTESRDFGRTWAKVAPSDIPNGNSKITLLKVGQDVLLIGNQCKDRSEVSLWVSKDGCKTWTKKIRLATIENTTTMEKIEHNPAMICYPDGFADDARKVLYLAMEDGIRHYFMKIPYADFR